jgi:hypothetical protein
MTTTYLVDLDTGERLALAIRPYDEDGKVTGITRAWLMRWRGSYGRRTGHKLGLVDVPAPAPVSLLPNRGRPMTDTERRGRGRPPTGVRVEANIPADVLAELDVEAAEHELTRAALIREVLEQYVRETR